MEQASNRGAGRGTEMAEVLRDDGNGRLSVHAHNLSGFWACFFASESDSVRSPGWQARLLTLCGGKEVRIVRT